jgi:hypothetical protein
MGHFLGIQRFSDKVAYDAMTKELNRAQARDRKAERESESAADHLRKLLSGKDAHDLNKTEFYPKLQKYIPQLREAFSRHVIRRTLDSIDYQGRKIFGMRPYLEHVMLIELRDWERSELNALTNEIVERNPLTTLVGTGKVSFGACSYLFWYPTPSTVPIRNGFPMQNRGSRSLPDPDPDPNLPIPFPPSLHDVSLLTYIFRTFT